MKILIPISQDRSILSLKPNAPLPPSFKLPRVSLLSIQTPMQCAFISLRYLTSLYWVTSSKNLCLPSLTLHYPISPTLLVILCSTICFIFSLHCVNEAFPKILSSSSTFLYYLHLREFIHFCLFSF